MSLILSLCLACFDQFCAMFGEGVRDGERKVDQRFITRVSDLKAHGGGDVLILMRCQRASKSVHFENGRAAEDIDDHVF